MDLQEHAPNMNDLLISTRFGTGCSNCNLMRRRRRTRMMRFRMTMTPVKKVNMNCRTLRKIQRV